MVFAGASGASGDGPAITAPFRAARLAARHAINRRVPNQPPATIPTRTTAARIQRSHGFSGVTTGGVPDQTGTLWPVAGSQDVLGNDVFLVEPEVACDCPHETAVEDPAGKLIPLLVFDGH